MLKALRVWAATAAMLALGLSAATAKASPACLDVALVLAVDSSGSVSAGEFQLQRRGIAAAFRDPAVIDAMARAGRVAVSVVFWGSDRQPKPGTGWVLVEDGAGAERFARLVEAAPRQVTGDTGLAAGLMAAMAKLAALDSCAVRRIINVSGDGEETRPLRGQRRSAPLPEARRQAESQRVEINALAIESDQPDLARYFADNVVTGPDAFVMEVSRYGDFAQALRRKLIREISPRLVTELADPPSASVLAR